MDKQRVGLKIEGIFPAGESNDINWISAHQTLPANLICQRLKKREIIASTKGDRTEIQSLFDYWMPNLIL